MFSWSRWAIWSCNSLWLCDPPTNEAEFPRFPSAIPLNMPAQNIWHSCRRQHRKRVGGHFPSHSMGLATGKSSPSFSGRQVMTHCVAGPKSSRIHSRHCYQHLLQGHLLNHYPRSGSSCLTWNQFWQGLTESVRSSAKVLVDSRCHRHCTVVITTSHCFLYLASLWSLMLGPSLSPLHSPLALHSPALNIFTVSELFNLKICL